MSAAVINAAAEPRQAVKTPAALRFFPSSRDVAFLLPWLLLLSSPAGISRLLGDGDTGWHLRTGEWILDHGTVPRQDLFSFTAEGRPWYAWEWLWDVCFGWLHRQAGLEGVVIATIALLSVSLLVLYRECLRREPDFLISFVLVFLAAGCSAIHWLARPHLFTIFFVLISAAVLDRARQGNVRLLAWLPLLTIVWANFHAGFFAAWTLLAAYAVGSAAEAFLDRRQVWPAARPYLVTWLGCLAASFVNPYGWQLHKHIWLYLTDSYHRDKIGEFQSVDFHMVAGAFFAAYLCLAGMSLLWSLQKRQLVDAIVLVGWGWLALYSARNLPILVFVTAPVVARACGQMLRAAQDAHTPLSALLRPFAEWRREMADIDRVPRLHFIAALGFVLLSAGVWQGIQPKWQAHFSPERFPVAAMNSVRNLPPSARLFASDYWGGYLIYRHFPSRRVFIDGRSDFYGGAHGTEMIHAIQAHHDWQQILDRHQVDSALLRPEDPLAAALKETRRWRPVFDDGSSILFVSRSTTRGAFAPETINRSNNH